jgi:hypothetical protein
VGSLFCDLWDMVERLAMDPYLKDWEEAGESADNYWLSDCSHNCFVNFIHGAEQLVCRT